MDYINNIKIYYSGDTTIKNSKKSLKLLIN